MSRDIADQNPVACAAMSARALADQLARWSAYAMAALLLAGVATLWCRHFAAAFRQPLYGLGYLLAGAFAAGTSLAARNLYRWAEPFAANRRAGGAFEWFMSFCLLAWGIAVSAIGADVRGLALLWTILAGEELRAWWSVIGLYRRRAASLGGAVNDREAIPETSEVPQTSEVYVGKGAHSVPVASQADVLQEFVRSRQPGGAERLNGWMRVPLVPGQRNASVHLAFCPPFVCTPSVTVTQQEGPAARIKTAQVLPFGARLDLKLAEPSLSNENVLLEISVHADGTEGEGPTTRDAG
jgi:hypothetical protein